MDFQIPDSLNWLDGNNVRPYIYMRTDNRIKYPGTRHEWDWFSLEPIYLNPLRMDEVSFANKILDLEGKSFHKSGMEMPRWVFFDCAVMPGFVAGFAHKTSTLPDNVRAVLDVDESMEWTPISLFIIIPTMARGEWVAHNLCSVNSLIQQGPKFYGLGFLTKAYGLWHANIETCCGMTQWQSPAVRLHSHYGAFEVLSAYTPVHSYAKTITYRCSVNPSYWPTFFDHQMASPFEGKYKLAGFQVDPDSESSLIEFQRRIENKEGPYFLNPNQIRTQDLHVPLDVYKLDV